MQSGVSADTLRQYERVGVLPRAPHAPNGYRTYPASALARVRLVRRALAVGFSLRDLARFLAERARGGAPFRSVRDLAAQKLVALETRIRELVAFRSELTALLREWDRKLEAIPKRRRAHLLEELGDPAGRSARPLRWNESRRGRRS